jgi:protein-arginine kinase
MGLVDIYRAFHPAIGQYTFFSVTHETFSKKDLILGHKASLKKYRKTEITACIMSDNHAIKLQLNNKRNLRIYSNTWKLKYTLLYDQWVIDKIREEIEELLEFH